ncbi:putative nuclease HARBI1 [Asparagus officinalis]|uniref:putative nuclease HARBI1 n=1 Tax=Asparagus officinalis TaxID=4686 RepID=UPI00098E3C5C|nr:putative nuclease HARBI1 [Asparagus officinalis]
MDAWLQFQHTCNIAVGYAICLFAYWFVHRRDRIRRLNIDPQEPKEVRDVVREIMSQRVICREMIRMNPPAFNQLCEILEMNGGLKPTRRATIEEQVAKFLYMLGHSVTTREVSKIFGRSGESVSRHFHNVLRAMIELEEMFFVQPDGSQVPSEILTNSKFYPYFKDCVGAIDGTHIRVKVSPRDAPRYRGRKDYPTQNVLAACTFDLKFTYVLPGWEGTASDSRIIKNALQRRFPLKIPQGKYYLVDAGFMLRSGLLPPYRGERYHLKKYSRNPPKNPRELFNLRHASLRNAIERSFGILKKRFPIIASSNEPNYSVKTQNKIILACCILHNFLRGVDPDDEFQEGDEQHNENQFEEDDVDEDEDVRRGEWKRDGIAVAMWQDYHR